MKAVNLIIICLSILYAFSVAAQQAGRPDNHERVALITDRSLYITGEQIQFSAVVYNESDPHAPTGNSVLYSEIITTDGIRVAGEKFPVQNGKSEGCIRIPADILSGIYIFRAYTRLMRNEGPEVYHYSMLKIVNPLKSEVAQATGRVLLPEEGTAETNTSNVVAISLDKEIYSTRDTIRLTIKGNIAELNRFSNLSLAVVPKAAGLSIKSMLPLSDVTLVKDRCFPEDRGIALTGKLVSVDENRPLAGISVNLSVIGKGRDFMAALTDSTGGFNFALPWYSGNRDLFISSAKVSGTETRILVNNDFCTLPVQVAAPEFGLSDEEKATAYNMAVNRMVQSAFPPDTVKSIVNAEMEERPFYGTPSQVLYLDQYVQLPTLEEYFNELPLLVKVRKRKGGKYFKVFGSQSELEVYDPLVLIDNVAVDDPERILKVSPQNVARIEIVNEPYVKGNLTYGGIISIFSKRGDFAGVDLPSSGMFLNYRFFHEDEKCLTTPPENRELPDTRNTLLWIPHVQPGEDGKAEYIFTTSDTPGNYLAVLNCLDTLGRVWSAVAAFRVK